MKFRLAIAVTALLPFASFGQSTKDQIKDLQRDLGLMQDQVRTLQRSQDERFAAMTVLVQQALDASNRASQSVAGLQGGLNQILGDQAKTVGSGVANVGNKVDQMSDEFRGVRESIADLNSRMSKLDAKLTDVSNALRTLAAAQQPAAPPGAAQQQGGAPGGAPPPSAQATYENAFRDYSGGKLDLSMQEFQEYLKWFKQSDLAPNAQYYIGDIYLRQGNADEAVKAFDAVLEQYPEGNKTPDAHYMKAKALFQSGQKTAAAQEYCEVIRLYPANDLATRSKAQIRGMGYSTCGGTAPAPATKKKAARR